MVYSAASGGSSSQFDETQRIQTLEVRGKLKKTIDEYKAMYAELVKSPETLMAIKQRTSDWLEREMRNLAIAKTKQSMEVLSNIFDHLTGDVVLKSFQLQTLERLNGLYKSNVNFQWFINSTAPSLLTVAYTNPVALNFPLFRNGIEGSVQDTDPETLSRLSSEEKAIAATIAATEGGFLYLHRRPWLAAYIFSLHCYRCNNSLEWLTTLIREFRTIEGGEPEQKVDPDSLSTDIPFPVMTGLPKLNDIGIS